MKHDIYRMKHEAVVEEILESLRQRIAHDAGCGVTLSGNRLTVRWYLPRDKKHLVQVHMVILEVEDGQPEEEEIPE